MVKEYYILSSRMRKAIQRARVCQGRAVEWATWQTRSRARLLLNAKVSPSSGRRGGRGRAHEGDLFFEGFPWRPRTCANATHEPLYVYSRGYGATAARLTPDRKIGWEFESLFPQHCVCVKTGRPPEPLRPFQNLGESSQRKKAYDCVPLGI